MTQKQIKQRLEALEKILNTHLATGQQYGLEHGASFECGWYIGTIKAAIVEIQIMLGK